MHNGPANHGGTAKLRPEARGRMAEILEAVLAKGLADFANRFITHVEYSRDKWKDEL